MKTRQSWHLLCCALWIVSGCAVGVGATTPHPAAAQTERPRVIFMHHSTGGGLLWEGGLREAFTEAGFDLWDHGYNDEGLTDPAGNALNTNWAVPDDNTDPDGWAAIFAQPVTDPPDNTFSYMLQYDIIIFKSCFPSSDIWDDARLDEYRAYYLAIRDVIDQHPDKLFIPWTTPPLVPSATTPENAQRAHQWAAYLTSEEYLAEHPNLAVFDINSIWSDEDGYLRSAYRRDEEDSHPNEWGNQTAAPLLVEFVNTAWRSFSSGEAPGVTGAASAATPQALPILPAGAPMTGPLGTFIGDFEGGDFRAVWWGDTVAGANTFTCAPEPPGFESEHALRIAYKLEAGLYAGCGRNLEPNPDWAAAEGLRFMWHSEPPGQRLSIVLTVDGVPFEAVVATPGPEWSEIILPWAMFPKAEWAESDSGEFDPAHITTFGLSLGDWESPQQGTLWLDTIQLIMPPG